MKPKNTTQLQKNRFCELKSAWREITCSNLTTGWLSASLPKNQAVGKHDQKNPLSFQLFQIQGVIQYVKTALVIMFYSGNWRNKLYEMHCKRSKQGR